jgi:hypothetical protein
MRESTTRSSNHFADPGQIATILLGIAFGVSLWLWIPKQTLLQHIVAGIVFLAIVLMITYWGYRFAIGFLGMKLQAYSPAFRNIAVGWYLLIGCWLAINIPLPSPPIEMNTFIPPIGVRITSRLVNGFAIGILLLLFSVWVAEKFSLPPKPNHPSKANVFLYIVFMIVVWGVYLLAFYPGMMSADSLVQWEQVLTGVYNDHHPAFHTFLIWLVTRISLTPVSVAVAQILALALVTGEWLAFFRQLGLPSWLIGLTVLGFSLSPVNGTMVNTLWKDIPYSIAVLGLTLIVAKTVFTKGKWLDSTFSGIVTGFTLAMVALLRHDGLPVAIGTSVMLLSLYLGKWRKWLVSVTIFGILYLGIRGPIYKWVGVQRSDDLAQASLSLWSMAIHVRPDSVTAKVLDSLTPFSSTWSCDIWKNISPTWRQTDLNPSPLSSELLENFIRRIPRILLFYFRCERSMEWIIWDPYGEVRNASHVVALVDPNPFGIHHDSKIPVLRNWIARWVMETSQNPNLNWFFWRPALFLYVNLLIAGILTLRNQDFRFLAISVPIIIQSITFTLILAAPNFRYHYAVYLVALICLPLLFSSPAIAKQSRT